MPKVKLTDAAVQKFKVEKGQRVDYFDASLPGFGLRVSGPTPRNPEGRRSWMLFYRFGGEQKRLTHERGYPALGLADARKWAGDMLCLLDKESPEDPAAKKASIKAEVARKRDTFETVMEDFIKRHLEGKRRAPRYIEETRRNFANHVLPRWKDRDLKSITRRDVIELLDAIVDDGTDVKRDGKMKHIDGGPIAANRVLAGVRALFNWALRRGLIETTPAALVERPGEETRRERVLTADELRSIWPVTEQLGTPVHQFFRTLMLLGQRREETAGMRWADLDLDGEQTWTIPADMTKAGRLHIVPLPPAAVKMLKAMPKKSFRNAEGKTEVSPFVFTVAGKTSISGYSAIKKRLDVKVFAARKKAAASAAGDAEAEAEDMPGWTPHDLRRTVATEMARLGVSRLTISKVLNHSDRSVTGIYDRHSYLAEKRHALETWASHLDSLVHPRGNNLVMLRVSTEAAEAA